MDTTVKPVALVADAIRDLGAQWQNLLCPLDQGGAGLRLLAHPDRLCLAAGKICLRHSCPFRRALGGAIRKCVHRQCIDRPLFSFILSSEIRNGGRSRCVGDFFSRARRSRR